MRVLSNTEIDKELLHCEGWRRWPNGGPGIEREWVLPTFLLSIAFVNQIAALAEKLNHHPDIAIAYNKVKLSIFTHDAGGLTAKDFDFAKAANALGAKLVE
jgi:4a-hydroxytetrahydrobiopterin dehydratase